MVKVVKSLTLVCILGLSYAIPLPRQPLDLIPKAEVTEDGALAVPGYQLDEDRQAILGALGSALAPVVGAVIGPLLTSFANGIVGAFTGNRPGSSTGGSSSSASKPTFEAFMINIPGAEGPYMLLTQESPDSSALAPYKIPGDSRFQTSPIGTVQLKPHQIRPILIDQPKSQELEAVADPKESYYSEEATS